MVKFSFFSQLRDEDNKYRNLSNIDIQILGAVYHNSWCYRYFLQLIGVVGYHYTVIFHETLLEND